MFFRDGSEFGGVAGGQFAESFLRRNRRGAPTAQFHSKSVHPKVRARQFDFAFNAGSNTNAAQLPLFAAVGEFCARIPAKEQSEILTWAMTEEMPTAFLSRNGNLNDEEDDGAGGPHSLSRSKGRKQLPPTLLRMGRHVP